MLLSKGGLNAIALLAGGYAIAGNAGEAATPPSFGNAVASQR
ncbi:hypothetical protein [Nostoc sp.]